MQTQPTAVTRWPELKCFQHCDRNANILCCSVPAVCPICHRDVSVTPMRIPPYILPSPFVTSSQAPCSIVLRPTTGDFIGNYSSIADLHIGMTDSSGGCYDFDEEGLHVGNTWPQCIAISMVMEAKGTSDALWDQSLAAFADPRVWTTRRYHERDCNCFDFVLHFLHFAGLQGRLNERVASSKQAFCEEFLLQRTSKAAKFVNLYRRVLQEGYVVDMVKS